MDLVFDQLDPHIESYRPQGATVILVRRASARHSAAELAALLRGKELLSARAVDEKTIEARFADDRTAALVAQYAGLGFDLGPFQIEQQDENKISLVRRGDSRIDAIELIASSRSDEWRKLLAHELDVVPLAASVYRDEFAGMDSIRILDIPANDTAALYLNVRDPRLADVAVRRRIAGAIRRDAIARVACGSAGCALPADVGDSDAQTPPRLEVLVPDDFTTFQTAGKVLWHQLFTIGLELTITRAPVNDIVSRMIAGKYELALMPLTTVEHWYSFFLSPGHPKAMPLTGLASAEYDAAVDRNDLAAAKEIVAREVPATRLFELRSFAAVDASFCGQVTPQASSWLWLSELYPCEEGREQ